MTPFNDSSTVQIDLSPVCTSALYNVSIRAISTSLLIVWFGLLLGLLFWEGNWKQHLSFWASHCFVYTILSDSSNGK